MVPVHQFCRIGEHAMVGTGARITQDIVPYALVGADPTRVVGINRVGLTRRNFSEETRTALKHAFRMIFYSKMLLSEAVVAVKEIYSNNPEIRSLVEFIASSQRGILLKFRKD
jgi:UDP-N-acetylglucosamine acyltransferase